MAAPFFISHDITGTSAYYINYGGSLAVGSNMANMGNLARSRVAKFTLTSTAMLIRITLPAGIMCNGVAIPAFSKTGAQVAPRIRAYSSTDVTGTALIDTGVISQSVTIQDTANGKFCIIGKIPNPTYIASISVYVTGAIGDVVTIPALIAGNVLQFDRCPQEPTIRPLFGGDMAYTSSGIAVPANPKRAGRSIDVPFGSMTVSDRNKLFAFEGLQGNKPFLACLFPDGEDWQRVQYTLTARFKEGLAYSRRGRTVNHSTGFTLVEV